TKAQMRYDFDAAATKFKPDKPLYTNAPWSESRLREAALKGDGLSASLCSGSNAAESLYWVSVSATNGWIPSQVRLAKDFESERPKKSKPGEIYLIELNYEVEAIWPQPRDFRRAIAEYWWGRAKGGLPKLKEQAAQNNPRALYGLGILYQNG